MVAFPENVLNLLKDPEAKKVISGESPVFLSVTANAMTSPVSTSDSTWSSAIPCVSDPSPISPSSRDRCSRG